MKRLLLIDDEDGIQEIWKRWHDVLEPTFQGECGLDTASDLETGLARLSGTKYDAVILDLSLPPKTPDEVISFIFERAAELPPIIVLTGDENVWTRRRCIMAGAAGFFTKHAANLVPNLFFKEIYNEYLKRYAAKG